MQRKLVKIFNMGVANSESGFQVYVTWEFNF